MNYRMIKSLIKADIRNISLDTTLVFAAFAPVALILVIRFGIPPLTTYLARELAFDLKPYYSLISIAVSLLIPMMYGMIFGFMMLDDRDDAILSYLSVTPLTGKGYLIYRLAAPTAVAWITSFLVIILINLTPVNLVRFIPVSLLLALEAPIVALLLGAFAANKVEGLALSKTLGIFIYAPLLTYFINSPWRFTAGLIPYFWPGEIYFALQEGDNPLLMIFSITSGLIIHLLFLLLLLKKFSRVAG